MPRHAPRQAELGILPLEIGWKTRATLTFDSSVMSPSHGRGCLRVTEGEVGEVNNELAAKASTVELDRSISQFVSSAGNPCAGHQWKRKNGMGMNWLSNFFFFIIISGEEIHRRFDWLSEAKTNIVEMIDSIANDCSESRHSPCPDVFLGLEPFCRVQRTFEAFVRCRKMSSIGPRDVSTRAQTTTLQFD